MRNALSITILFTCIILDAMDTNMVMSEVTGAEYKTATEQFTTKTDIPSGSITRYISVGVELSAIPSDIPFTVISIILQSANIRSIDYIEPFPKLASLDLSRNALTRFPNLANVSRTLRTLKLRNNNLTTDEAIPHLAVLRKLDLSYNSLTRVPDLSNLSISLESLDLSYNLIKVAVIPSPMRSLQYLQLISNRLTMFPNVTNAPGLRYLRLDSNGISKDDKLTNVFNLEVLHMEDNHLKGFPNIGDAIQLQELYLFTNIINELRPLPAFPALRKLVFHSNKLTRFPDLANISATIEVLDLSHNNIASVPFVPKMPKLRTLSLQHNQLKEFPDLRNVSATLATLTIEGNDISFTDDYLLAPFSNLALLTIGQGNSGTPLHMPNVCYMGTSKQLSLIVHSKNIVCDLSALFTKLAEEAGIVTIGTAALTPKCVEPPELSGRNFMGVSAHDIAANIKCSQQLYKKRSLSENWACPTNVQIVSGFDSTKCAFLCMKQSDCMMFTTNVTHCILMRVNGVPYPSAFSVHDEWFVLK